jgi:hypothetical protein
MPEDWDAADRQMLRLVAVAFVSLLALVGYVIRRAVVR